MSRVFSENRQKAFAGRRDFAVRPLMAASKAVASPRSIQLSGAYQRSAADLGHRLQLQKAYRGIQYEAAG
jgi:hypothetical protein